MSYDKLDHMGDKLDALRAKLDQHALDDQRRFGRILTALVVIGIALATPKLGGPSIDHLVAGLL